MLYNFFDLLNRLWDRGGELTALTQYHTQYYTVIKALHGWVKCWANRVEYRFTPQLCLAAQQIVRTFLLRHFSSKICALNVIVAYTACRKYQLLSWPLTLSIWRHEILWDFWNIFKSAKIKVYPDFQFIISHSEADLLFWLKWLSYSLNAIYMQNRCD